jgi:hypothetical protein
MINRREKAESSINSASQASVIRKTETHKNILAFPNELQN